MRYIIALLAVWAVCEGAKKKKKSEYTQKDWDRIAREWEREEIEEDEKEEKENRKGKGLKFDPNGNTDNIIAQAKQGKPTMIFFTLKEKDCPSQKALEQISQRYASMLLSGHVPVSNYPVGERRTIFMTKEGSQSMEIKNFLLKQPEVENVSIDNRVYTPASGDQPLHPDDPVMRKILGQAALTDKELAKRKAKEEEDDANIEAEGAPPGPGSPDSPDSPDFPLDPAGKIDLSKVAGPLMTDEEMEADIRSDEEFMADSGMSKDDPIIKELMDSKPGLDNLKGGPNNVHSEKDNSLEKTETGDEEMEAEPAADEELPYGMEDTDEMVDKEIEQLNMSDKDMATQEEDFIKNSGLPADDPIIKELMKNRPNMKNMKKNKIKSANAIPEHNEL